MSLSFSICAKTFFLPCWTPSLFQFWQHQFHPILQFTLSHSLGGCVGFSTLLYVDNVTDTDNQLLRGHGSMLVWVHVVKRTRTVTTSSLFQPRCMPTEHTVTGWAPSHDWYPGSHCILQGGRNHHEREDRICHCVWRMPKLRWIWSWYVHLLICIFLGIVADQLPRYVP